MENRAGNTQSGAFLQPRLWVCSGEGRSGDASANNYRAAALSRAGLEGMRTCGPIEVQRLDGKHKGQEQHQQEEDAQQDHARPPGTPPKISEKDGADKMHGNGGCGMIPI
jgi:hypothetical protein